MMTTLQSFDTTHISLEKEKIEAIFLDRDDFNFVQKCGTPLLGK